MTGQASEERWTWKFRSGGAGVDESDAGGGGDAGPLDLLLAVAHRNVAEGGRPFACVIVRDGAVLSAQPNRVVQTSDPTAHAEILAIREACVAIGSEDLTGCDVYIVAEPCPMCLSALYYASPDRVRYLVRRADYHPFYSDDRRYFRFGELYQEIGKPLEQRAMPMEPAAVSGGIDVFKEWHQRSLAVQNGRPTMTNGDAS
jgi:tRNA(Arg) A34 adenosine deaminase TadA